MDDNNQSKLNYNVIIKPRGYGKTYKLIEALRKEPWLTKDNVENKLKKF